MDGISMPITNASPVPYRHGGIGAVFAQRLQAKRVYIGMIGRTEVERDRGAAGVSYLSSTMIALALPLTSSSS